MCDIFTLILQVCFTAIHYSDVIMGVMGSQITSLTIVYSTVYSGADQRKHQSSASLAFMQGNHRWQNTDIHVSLPVKKLLGIWVHGLHELTGADNIFITIRNTTRPYIHPNYDISIEFEIWPKFAMLWLKMYSTNHNKILHTSRQCNCGEVC